MHPFFGVQNSLIAFQSPLSFSPYSRTDLITTNYSLGQSLARHYISGALFRAGWVVGSLDIIGSPAGFTRIVGDGIKDFVGLPYQVKSSDL